MLLLGILNNIDYWKLQAEFLIGVFDFWHNRFDGEGFLNYERHEKDTKFDESF